MKDANNLRNAFARAPESYLNEFRNDMFDINEFMQKAQKSLDKLWVLALRHKEHLNANKCNYSRSGKTSKMPVKCLIARDTCSSTVNNSSLDILTIRATEDIVNIATTTVTIPTTLPANPLTVNDTSPEPNIIESFVYVKEEFRRVLAMWNFLLLRIMTSLIQLAIRLILKSVFLQPSPTQPIIRLCQYLLRLVVSMI